MICYSFVVLVASFSVHHIQRKKHMPKIDPYLLAFLFSSKAVKIYLGKLLQVEHDDGEDEVGDGVKKAD